jgi:hypothetical protein
MFLPAFGTFPSVVSAFVMSHKPTFARFWSKSKASDWDKPTCPSNRQRQGSKVVGASKIWRILYWRQVVSALALITFAQEGYYFREAIPFTAIEASRRDILPGFG